jgi:hypothetical protein
VAQVRTFQHSWGKRLALLSKAVAAVVAVRLDVQVVQAAAVLVAALVQSDQRVRLTLAVAAVVRVRHRQTFQVVKAVQESYM